MYRLCRFSEVEQERNSLCNVPPNYSESVCVPEFNEKFLSQGKSGSAICRQYSKLIMMLDKKHGEHTTALFKQNILIFVYDL